MSNAMLEAGPLRPFELLAPPGYHLDAFFLGQQSGFV